MKKIFRAWRQDRLLVGVVKNSSFLFSSNVVMAAISFFQGIIVARLVGMEGLGIITTVTTFASNVHRLLSFRMSEVVVKHLGQSLAEDQRGRAAAAIKAAALIEALTALIAYLLLVIMAPWAARVLVKNSQLADLFIWYGCFLLANFVYETSVGVLQVTRRFDRLATINIVQSFLTAGMILLAWGFHWGVREVLAAYLVGKVFAGLAVLVAAFRQLDAVLGREWRSAPLKGALNWKNMGLFALNTNLQGTVNLFVRDSIPNLLAALRPEAVANTEVGYFRLAMMLINLVMMPVDPLIAPTYTEITQTIAHRQWKETLSLLRRVTGIAALWTGFAGGGLALLGWLFIPLLYKPASLPAYPAVLLLLIGYGFANIFNWNRSFLLALGKPEYPLLVSVQVGILELSLMFWLTPLYGYLACAAILSGYFVISISLTIWLGLRQLRLQRLRDLSSTATGREDVLLEP